MDRFPPAPTPPPATTPSAARRPGGAGRGAPTPSPAAAGRRTGLRGVAVLAAAALAAGACGTEGDDGSTGEIPGDGEALQGTVVEGGFATPESILHDEEADVYLVSNISGDPLARDGDGFVSRVSPDGEILELRWIDGTAEAVELNAPKGMAISGDTLYVADIDCVRMFGRVDGAPVGEVCFPDATFLNDVAVDANGVLYVTDSGVTTGFEPSGTDAVYRFSPDGRRATLAEGEELGQPNGITFGSRGGFVAAMGSGEIYQLGPDGSKNTVLPPADRQLDGIVFTPAGGFLFSSWSDEAVFHVTPDGQVERVVENVAAPADIGLDARRGRVLVPLFQDDRLLFRAIEGVRESDAGGTGGGG